MRPYIFILLAFAGLCHAEDEAERALNDARRLAEQGAYEEALEKHVWFHNNALTIRPSYYGVRLSFALSDWVDLGKKYPKALETLKKIRDEKTAKLLASEGTRGLFHDVESINEALEDYKATVTLFKQLDSANPRFATAVYDIAEDALVYEWEYSLARKYLGDPVERLKAAKQSYLESISPPNTASRSGLRRLFVRKALRVIKILNESGDADMAKTIQAEALKIVDDDELRTALPKKN